MLKVVEVMEKEDKAEGGRSRGRGRQGSRW